MKPIVSILCLINLLTCRVNMGCVTQLRIDVSRFGAPHIIVKKLWNADNHRHVVVCKGRYASIVIRTQYFG